MFELTPERRAAAAALKALRKSAPQDDRENLDAAAAAFAQPWTPR